MSFLRAEPAEGAAQLARQLMLLQAGARAAPQPDLANAAAAPAQPVVPA